jgi:hypothetical protein
VCVASSTSSGLGEKANDIATTHYGDGFVHLWYDIAREIGNKSPLQRTIWEGIVGSASGRDINVVELAVKILSDPAWKDLREMGNTWSLDKMSTINGDASMRVSVLRALHALQAKLKNVLKSLKDEDVLRLRDAVQNLQGAIKQLNDQEMEATKRAEDALKVQTERDASVKAERDARVAAARSYLEAALLD